MTLGKHQFTRETRRGPGDFAPLFDWRGEDEEPPQGECNDAAALSRLAAACAKWIGESEGVIVRFTWGLRTVNCRRYKDRDDGNFIETPTYEAFKYTSPFGALLHGQPSRFSPIADAMRALSVDEYWTVGCVHGVDNTPAWLLGKRLKHFEDSPAYRAGREAGAQLAAEFIQIPGGWEV